MFPVEALRGGHVRDRIGRPVCASALKLALRGLYGGHLESLSRLFIKGILRPGVNLILTVYPSILSWKILGWYRIGEEVKERLNI